jgi:cobalt-precorrin 5A hydrolase
VKLAVITITKNGFRLGAKIAKEMGADLYAPENGALCDCPNFYAIKGNFIEFVHGIFNRYEALVFFTAAGIAVRAIAKVLRDKTMDPAVVVADERGKFAVSLLSGHLGGANELAVRVAEILGAVPVVTTASDTAGFEGIDVMAKKMGFCIERFFELKRVSACLVNGEKVAFVAEPGIPENVLNAMKERLRGTAAAFCRMDFSDNSPRDACDTFRDAAAAVFITDGKIAQPGIPHVVLRPRDMVLGIGTKKGTAFEKLLDLVKKAMEELGISENRIGCIATIDMKKDEECINMLARHLDAPVKYYSCRELANVEEKFPISYFVKKTTGVGSVARPAAYLASMRGMELKYCKMKGITLAVYKCNFWCSC